MSKVLATRAVVLAALVTMFTTFAMHAPCRNTNYLESQFTSFCYSDIPVQFAERDFTEVAPVPQMLMQLISKLPGDFLIHTLVLQLFIAAAFVTIALLIMQFPAHKMREAVIFALMPLWLFISFIATDMFAILFGTAAIYFWYNRKLHLSALTVGFAIASGSWTWVIALAVVIQLYKYATLKWVAKYSGITALTALILNLSNFITQNPILALSDEYGDGTPLYIWSLVAETGNPTGYISIWIGLALTVFLVRWATLTAFDHRLELLILIFVCVQVLTDTSISPQSLTHVLWLAVLCFPNPAYLLRITVPMIVYVVSVWLNYERSSGETGISPINYAVFSVLLWVVVIAIGFKAADYIAVPGDDELLASQNFEEKK
jgi:hypothetical protein